MNVPDRKLAMKVAVQHAAKQVVELTLSVGSLTEKLTERPAQFDVDATWARGNIAAIRRELSDLEHLLAGREPPIPVAPVMAAE